VIVVFGFFGSWSFLAPLGSAALAPGTLAVESYRKTVQHLEGGIVEAIHVRDGDNVLKGQILVELEDTSSVHNWKHCVGSYFRHWHVKRD